LSYQRVHTDIFGTYYSKRLGRLDLQETFPLVCLKGGLMTVGFFV